MSISTSLVQTDQEFLDLQAPWTRLAASAVSANTFLGHDWLYSWWTAYRPDARLAIVVARRAGEIVGIAPMMVMRQGRLGRLFRRLRFIGDGTSETDHMNFVVAPEGTNEVIHALLGAIDALPWDIAHFSQIPRDSGNTSHLLEHARLSGWLVTTVETSCPVKALPATYEELLKSLPPRLRTAIRSSRRQLAEGHRTEFGRVEREEELPAALEALYRNHASRWQARGQQGVFVDPRKRRFYELLSQRLLRAGSLHFYSLKLDGRVVAQQYCFEHDGTVMLLQEGFDFAYAKQNVGNVLRSMVFEDLIRQRVRAYDFLAGSSRHKESWSDQAVIDINVRACRPTLLGHAAHRIPPLLRRAQASMRAREAARVE